MRPRELHHFEQPHPRGAAEGGRLPGGL